VLDHVENLLSRISGKAAITADHGNYVGERASPVPVSEYRHPRGLYDDPVVRVPWLEVVKHDRRKIHTGRAKNADSNISPKDITARLRNLGYQED
jgi:hypothetical protein